MTVGSTFASPNVPTAPPGPATIVAKTTPADHRAFIRHRELALYRGRFVLHMAAVPAVLLGYGGFEAWRAGGIMPLLAQDILVALLPAAVALWLLFRWTSLDRKARRMSNRSPPEAVLTATPQHLIVADGRSTQRHAWRDLVGIVETRGLVLFVHKHTAEAFRATILPARQDAGGSFTARAKALWAAQQAPVGGQSA